MLSPVDDRLDYREVIIELSLLDLENKVVLVPLYVCSNILNDNLSIN